MPSNLKMFQTTNKTQIEQMAQLVVSFRTTTLSTAMTGTMTTKQVNPVHVHQDTSCKAPLRHCAHVHKSTIQVVSLEKSQAPTQWKDFCEQTPLTKHNILSQYSGCFEGIRHFPGDPYKFHLKPEHKPA